MSFNEFGFDNELKDNNNSISSHFENDSKYWNEYLSNIGDYVKFYNIKSNEYKSTKIHFNNEAIIQFLNQYDASKFDFTTAVFSLYISRINRAKGCLLKTAFSSNDNIISSREKDISRDDEDKFFLLKIDYLNEKSFIEYLNEIKLIIREAEEHAKSDIGNYIGSDLSYYSLYDLREFKESDIFNGEGSALTLNLYDKHLDLLYNSDLFSDIYIEHMAANIKSLINEVIENPNQTLDNVDILSDDEKNLLAGFCKGKSIDIDKDKTFAMAFRETAIKYSDSMAIDDGVNQVSYSELELSSNSIAYDLRENHGIKFGDCVGLMLPRSYHFIELVLALNKIGAVFTPIDPSYPLKRIEHVLDISEATSIVTSKEYALDIDLNVNVIHLEDMNMEYKETIECVGSEDDLFAIYFTSGTTGLPKGVMISNKQIMGMSVAYRDTFKTSAGNTMGYFASFSFIASIRFFVSFIYGECCRLFNESEQKDSLLLIKVLKQQEISDLILPPSLGIPIFEKEDIKLKHLILAGARLNELGKKERATKLVNFYGSTEVIMAAVNIIENNAYDENVPIGRPVPNTWIYILDNECRELPVGVPGELCISSEFISSGYYNRPDLTDEFFMLNPHSTCKENERMYRTGDIGFYNFDGEIVVIGREDDQLSVRGFRIESGEILSIMGRFNEISDIYLDVDHDNLALYYVASDDLNIDDVKEALKLELPDYMIPSIFISLEEIPRNANGKLDKFALNSMVREDKGIDIEIGDEVLLIVVDGFKEVLNCDSVFIDDKFLSLGGNSLSAMKLQMMLNEKLGVNLHSREIMELQTPIGIRDHIKYNLEVHSPVSVNYTFEDSIPLSEAQLNVYLDERVNDMGTAYNNPFKIEFDRNYSVDEIKESIEKLLNVYPVLSARVIDDDGTLSLAFDAKPEIIDGLKEDIESFVNPFNLGKNLSRFLIAEDDGFNCLCVDFHHLVFDGTSANIIINTLMSILEGNGTDFVDNGVLRQISFEENITHEYMGNAEENITHEYMGNAYEFFDSMLADRDEAYGLLPSVKTEENSDFEYIDAFNIDNEKLDSFLISHSITHNQFFCSVFAYALSRFAGSSKVLFNLIEDGRGHIDLSESVGMFVRTLPLLIDCNDKEISSFLDYSSELISQAMKYDLYPFRLLANQYDLNSDIFFQYSHGLFSKLMENERLGYRIDDLKQDTMGDLEFYIFNLADDELGIKVLYSEKFSLEFIERFVESYKLILKEMMSANCLSEIDFTQISDLNTLDAYNQTEKDLAYNDILVAFNENLSKYPDNRLVSYKDISYSYGEGASIADSLSKGLIDYGVNFQECVPFLVERSELYMFCALGILSVGAIYVPLDDNLPDERIRFMLNDCVAKVLIVSDETYERANGLGEDIALLNISDILKEDIETASSLPFVCGDLGCILYTSGTTGIPKGVKIRRKGILNFVDYYVNRYDMDNSSVFGLFASIGFDVGAIRGICAPLYGGASLDIVPEDIRLDMDKLNRHFMDMKVTHTTLPTQVARLFIDEVDNPTLKVLNTGGEKLGDVSYSTDYSFIDSYGPTECCVAVCDIEAKDKLDSSSIGHLFANIKAYVLDEEGRRVPIGAVGELCIAGYQVADGYLNRLEETDSAFVKNPFEDEDEYSLIYCTGDLVRVLPDGSLGIVGRRDSQVKVRGNRVELLEVEALIREMDSIESVTVQTVEHKGNHELVAYVVSDDENLEKEVCAYVASHKPDFMVPSFVVELDSIPLTVNGKVDKRALPKVDRDSLHAEYIAPRNEKERAIAEAFERIFDKEKIGIHDDFIRLGGDSLNAIKLLSYLEDYDITTSDIFSLRTPAAIAESIDDFSLDLDIYSLDSGCPLNAAQVNLFADVMINDSFDFYQIPTYMAIDKKYGLQKVLDTLDEMIRVHPVLAMHLSNHYEEESKNLFERIHDNINVFKDLGASGNNENGTEELKAILRNKGWNIKGIYEMFRIILRLFKGEYPYMVKGSKPPISIESGFNQDTLKNFIDEPLDLYNYLSRYKIVETDDSYLLLAKAHHIIFDGISSSIFKRDFQRLLDGAHIDIDDSFLRMSAFTQEIKNTDKFDEAVDFYDSMLEDIGEVGGLLEDSSASGFSINTHDIEFDHNAFKSFLDETGLSEYVLFTSVFAYTMSKFTDSDNVSFSMIENGRDRFNDYDSIGLYAGVVPMLINCENQSINSFLEQASSRVYGVLKYNYYPLFMIAQKYGFNVNVIFQYVPDWISYDIILEDDSEFFSSDHTGDLINDLLANRDDLIANFIVQIIQNAENYSIMIVNSNNFSQKMANDFKDTFSSVLSKIINGDMDSDLSSLY